MRAELKSYSSSSASEKRWLVLRRCLKAVLLACAVAAIATFTLITASLGIIPLVDLARDLPAIWFRLTLLCGLSRLVYELGKRLLHMSRLL